MNRSYLFLGTVITVILTIFSGVIQGRLSHRWGKPVDFEAAARKLAGIPQQCGPWELKSSEELSERVVQELDCAGYVLRTYVNPESGARVQMAILLGPPGPTSVHTPDICYSSRDYRIVQDEKHWNLTDDQREHVFWATTMEPLKLEAGLLRVYHAWSTGGEWSAPNDARFAFAGSRHLYKIQVAGPLTELSDAETDKDSVGSFLKFFVPAAQLYLVPPDNE